PVHSQLFLSPKVAAARDRNAITRRKLVEPLPRCSISQKHTMVVLAGQRQAAPRFDRNGLVVINNVSIVDSLSVSSVEYILCSLVPNEISNLDETFFGKDISMIGQTGPALIEDLGHRLRREVIRFVSDDLQYISLPVLEWRVLDEEREHVAL